MSRPWTPSSELNQNGWTLKLEMSPGWKYRCVRKRVAVVSVVKLKYRGVRRDWSWPKV